LASKFAIASVGQSIANLLASACPRSDFPDAEFQLYQAANFQKPMREGISLYLYKVDPANNIRNLPPRISGTRRFRPSVPIDLHFLLTAWAQEGYQQLRLLGWAMREIENSTTLGSGVLNQQGPEADAFLPNESVDIILETISLQDLTNIWEVGKPAIQPSVSYVVRMVRLDSEIEMQDAKLARTRDFNYAEVLR